MLSEDCTKSAVLFNSKKRILEYIAELAHQRLPEVPEYNILEALMSREKLGSTGLGQGIAIPHGRIKGLKHAAGAFLRLATPVPFDSPDGRPVNLLFCKFAIIIVF